MHRAPDARYKFTLKELYDRGTNPRNAVYYMRRAADLAEEAGLDQPENAEIYKNANLALAQFYEEKPEWDRYSKRDPIYHHEADPMEDESAAVKAAHYYTKNIQLGHQPSVDGIVALATGLIGKKEADVKGAAKDLREIGKNFDHILTAHLDDDNGFRLSNTHVETLSGALKTVLETGVFDKYSTDKEGLEITLAQLDDLAPAPAPAPEPGPEPGPELVDPEEILDVEELLDDKGYLNDTSGYRDRDLVLDAIEYAREIKSDDTLFQNLEDRLNQGEGHTFVQTADAVNAVRAYGAAYKSAIADGLPLSRLEYAEIVSTMLTSLEDSPDSIAVDREKIKDDVKPVAHGAEAKAESELKTVQAALGAAR